MSSAKSGAKVRAEAAKAVDAVVRGGQSLDAALEAAETFINPADRALLHYLSYGTLRRYWQLKAWLDALLQKPLRARDSVVQSLILVGIYQLTDSRVPDHAAVSTTVEAARILRQPKFKSLINAVLRNFRRQNIEDQPPRDDVTRYSHPEWLGRCVASLTECRRADQSGYILASKRTQRHILTLPWGAEGI